MASSTTLAVDAPVLAAEFDVVLSVPEEATAVLMQVRSGEKQDTMSVQTPVTAATIRASLLKGSFCHENLTGVQLNFQGEQIELAEVYAEARLHAQ
eukprot:scaffold38504_cov111-Phaeocystis_antarctica.AAC.6